MVEADDELVDQEELLTWLDIGGRRSAWGTGDPNSQDTTDATKSRLRDMLGFG